MDVTGALDMNRSSGIEEQSLHIQNSNHNKRKKKVIRDKFRQLFLRDEL